MLAVGMRSVLVDLAPLEMRAAVANINADARTVDLVFSTGAGVVRFDHHTGRRYLEKLSLKPKHIRLGRLNDGASLLDTHSAYSLANVIGAVVEGSARVVSDTEARATVRFSRRDAVEPIWQDVRDGIIKFTSAGYRVHRFEETTGASGEMPVRTAIDWEPFEISMVPMGADAGARVRAADKALLNPCLITRASDDAERSRRLRLALARS
jgi:hypothetical protein